MKTTTTKVSLAAAVLAASTLCGPSLAADEIPAPGEVGGPTHALTPGELAKWIRGRALFDKPFHRQQGLGTPEMNADSCRACHQDPVMGGAGGLELNVSRCATDNDGQGPFQDLPGGQVLSKLRPPWEDGREEYDDDVADVFEQRQTPSILGGGLIDSISDVEILSHEDPNDSDMDGVRGIARTHMVNGQLEVGRFGWKGQIPRMGDFIRDAMAGECGITTPDDGRGFGLSVDGDSVADPELSPADFDSMLFFLTLLGPPPRGGSTDPAVLQGEDLFEAVGCDSCHIPTLLGADGPVPLYSDLLLHDVMGPGFRGMEEPGAPSGFFRTPPLWGIKGTAPYMHDGRAETLRAAINAHKGEGASSRRAFRALSEPQKQALILFLKDL